MSAALSFLADKLADDFAEGVFEDEVADSLSRNLNPALPLRPYQVHTLATFAYYWHEYRARRRPLREKPAHLLLNMATGSGKTLLMAANMLALYAQGYRRFLFVVDSKNIVEKTRANFTDPGNPKYLFAPQVEVAGRTVQVVAVDSFEGANPDDLSILFDTAAGLHTDLRTPREQGLSYEDLARQPLVLLADEAHHFNKATKSRQAAADEETSWENTILRLLHQRPDNVLLEYTATVDFSDRALAEKYADKLLVRYSLKEFRQDGYSKEIRLLKSGGSRWVRVAQALLLSQWRLKVYNATPALASPYAPFKPVVLFKSPTVAASETFFTEFGEWLDELTGERLAEITAHSGPTLGKALAWFQAHSLPLARLADELREAFRPDRCIIVNSQNDSEAKQLELNRLEEGPVRAVFTVQMLTEGWDVLNLYDIVRLDEGNGVSGSITRPKPSKATTQEAQLLGRGARYFPWQRPGHDAELNRRKLDKDLGNPLRCLEELYYHSINDSTYVAALTKELVEAGIYDPRNDDGTPRTVRVKPSFKQLPIWETGLLYTNERVRTGTRQRVSLRGTYAGAALNITYELPPDGTAEATVFDFAEAAPAPDRLPFAVPLLELGVPVLRKALESYPFFEFTRLRQVLPQLTSVRELLTSDDYLGKSTFMLHATEAQRQTLQHHQKLAAARRVMGELQSQLGQKLHEYVGSTAFTGKPLKSYLANDRVAVVQDGANPETAQSMTTHPDAALRLDVSAADWFIYDEFYGTSEEKHFIKYLAAALPDLHQRFRDIYLLRNDKLFQLYNFADGRPFEPDFVLFLTEKNTHQALSWQVFIEPKGPQLLLLDAWKQDFLLSIHARVTNASLQLLFENEEVRLHGLPFYTYSQTSSFDTAFQDLLTGQSA